MAISPNETACFDAGKSRTRKKHTSVRSNVEGEEKLAKILLRKAEKKRVVGESASLERGKCKIPYSLPNDECL